MAQPSSLSLTHQRIRALKLCMVASLGWYGVRNRGFAGWPSRINRTMLIATLYIRCQLTPDAHIRRAMELGEGTLARVHDSAIYKSLLPLVGPFTEPAVKRLLDSPTFQVGHCKIAKFV